ncbi:hypothetical protein EAI_06130 [Harpegnathos saltator]|uniref:Uncharacterized protein n=1 Tax=Harpegnathos saltator TaxID=610380 RepID=E2C9K8_HARSA|nr:hypothetical protein EAI_06130 [Harpegnathos saltator]
MRGKGTYVNQAPQGEQKPPTSMSLFLNNAKSGVSLGFVNFKVISLERLMQKTIMGSFKCLAKIYNFYLKKKIKFHLRN